MLKKNIEGVEIVYRENSSDLKSQSEIFSKKTYENKRIGFVIEAGESWLDLGANIGLFALFCFKRGAKAYSYEPHKETFDVLKKNSLNMNNEVFNYGVSFESGELNFYIPVDGNFWRNSTINHYKRKAVKVEKIKCLAFKEVAKNFKNIKMDIEGSEFEILEKCNLNQFKKLVFEYSFDKDHSIARFKKIIKKLKSEFEVVDYPKFDETKETYDFFPPCLNVFCRNY